MQLFDQTVNHPELGNNYLAVDAVKVAVRYDVNEVAPFLASVIATPLPAMPPQLPHPRMWMEWEATEKTRYAIMLEQEDELIITLFANNGDKGMMIACGKYATGDIVKTTELLSDEFIGKLAYAATHLAFYAIQLLNCKNVTTETVANTMNDRRKQKAGLPFDSFKVLKLPVGKTVARSASMELPEVASGMNRFHIRRGHFKTYTPEKPLLGRAVGTYWWPQVAAGNKKNGQVIKDYAIKV